MVFYLKYRPQKIADLDLPEVRTGLAKIVNSGKIPHALLLTGPRGSGKTSAARILSRAVNCEKNKGKGEPCNKCATCQEITSGSFIDLLEIDGASNRGIDDVRTLRENIRLAPANGRFKVYIIDEVHMLTTEAFNALLKTLEEPPSHALFILCTTEPGKLPETITSRCTHFRFRKAKPDEVRSSLGRIIKGEKLKIEPEALDLISKSVDGSFRDGGKILDQLSSGSKEITLKEARQLLGEVESLSPANLIKTLAEYDMKAGLIEVNRLMESGVDLKLYSQKLLEMMRLILMTRVGIDEFEETGETKALNISALKELILIFSASARDLKNAVIPQLPLELAIIEWGQKSQIISPTSSLPSKEPLKSAHSAPPAPPPNPVKKTIAIDINDSGVIEKINSYWPEVLLKVRPMNHSVEALLRGARPHQMTGETLTLEVFYAFHKERLETEKCRSIVEEVVSEVLGSPVKIKCILGEREVTKPDSASLAPSSTVAAAEAIFSGKMID